MKHHITALALATVAFAGGCGDDAQADLCDRVPGAEFTSEEEIGALLTEEGVVPSTEDLSFYDDGVDWYTGDTVISGGWMCSGSDVTWLDGDFAGELTEEDGRLVLTGSDDLRWIATPPTS